MVYYLLNDSCDKEFNPYDIICCPEYVSRENLQAIIDEAKEEYDFGEENGFTNGYDGSDCVYDYVVWKLTKMGKFILIPLGNDANVSF